ncbi:MAG: DNA mismatch endonuclease Vsr [Candidatus Omnitrophica bacterium]|nr:DNA mismatch endonuclease Vsr [Candidatus Omnitrophota bacterium]
MVDTVSKKLRSWNMSRIKAADTAPELRVRKVLHREGYRYGLHNKNLKGKPDLVFRKYKTVVFVNGCFWHHHKGCKRANLPKSNQEYWIKKIEGNIQRDKENRENLKKLNWTIVTIWECQTYSDKTIIRLFEKGIKANG